eukprot:357218-Chlamydomonas_euryale.AAC.28
MEVVVPLPIRVALRVALCCPSGSPSAAHQGRPLLPGCKTAASCTVSSTCRLNIAARQCMSGRTDALHTLPHPSHVSRSAPHPRPPSPALIQLAHPASSSS